MDISEFKQTLHVSSENFEKIITDLEDMLTQALELAGRAVEGGALAGGLGYSPSTRKDGAKLVKRLKSVRGMTPDEDNQSVKPPVRTPSLGHEAGVSRPSKGRKDSLPTLYSEEAMESSIERLRAIALNSASCEAVVSGLDFAGSQSRLHLASQGVGKEESAKLNRSISGKNTNKHDLVGMQEVLEAGPALLKKAIVAREQSRGRSQKNQRSRSLLGVSSNGGQGDIEVWESSKGTVILVDGGYHDFLREMARNQPPMKPYRVGSNGSGGSGLSGRPADRRRSLPVDRMWYGLLTNGSSGASGTSWGGMRKRFTTAVMLWVLGFEWGLVGA